MRNCPSCLGARSLIDEDLVDFTRCLEKADLPSCTWYLEQLKAVSIIWCFASCYTILTQRSARLLLPPTRWEGCVSCKDLSSIVMSVLCNSDPVASFVE